MYGKCRDGVARGQIPYELGKCAGNLYSMCFNRDLVEWNGPLNLSVKNDVIIISPKPPPKPELGVHMTVDQPDVIDHQECLALQGSSSAFEQVPATHAYPTQDFEAEEVVPVSCYGALATLGEEPPAAQLPTKDVLSPNGSGGDAPALRRSGTASVLDLGTSEGNRQGLADANSKAVPLEAAPRLIATPARSRSLEPMGPPDGLPNKRMRHHLNQDDENCTDAQLNPFGSDMQDDVIEIENENETQQPENALMPKFTPQAHIIEDASVRRSEPPEGQSEQISDADSDKVLFDEPYFMAMESQLWSDDFLANRLAATGTTV